MDTVVAAEFHPLERNCIVTCGKAHISFWVLDAGGTLYKRMGVFENRDKPKYVTCLAFTQHGDVLSGDSNGNIIVWGRGMSLTELSMIVLEYLSFIAHRGAWNNPCNHCILCIFFFFNLIG